MPRMLGRYLVGAEIASGGMGAVHLATARGVGGFKRVVAVKRLFGDRDLVAMVRDEARIASRIRHPNVVPVLDVVDDAASGELLLVMEYVHGESLAKMMNGPVAPDIASAIAIDVLRGLHAAHEVPGLSIIHRDVSPQNVIVGTDGVARLVDFGIAKAHGRAQQTRTGDVKGKTAYMAPEQLRGEGVDRRVDVYAAAVVLWEMLTGSRLFSGDNQSEVALKVIDGDRVRPSDRTPAAAPLDDVVLDGMSYDPADRYPTALAMADAIASAMPPASPARVGEWALAIAGEALRARESAIAELEALADPRERERRAPAFLLAAAAALVLAGITIAALTRSPSATSVAPPPSAAPNAPSMTYLEAPPPSNSVPPTVRSSPPPRVAPAARPRPSAHPKSASCDPPYRVDESGVRIPKLECY